MVVLLVLWVRIKLIIISTRNIFSHNTEAFAYPYGDVTEDAKKALKEAHVLCGFTTHYGRVKVGDDPTFLPRVRVLGNASLESYIYTIK